MKSKECIKCEMVLDCKVKPTDKPCLHFRERKDNEKKQIRKPEDRL